MEKTKTIKKNKYLKKNIIDVTLVCGKIIKDFFSSINDNQ